MYEIKNKYFSIFLIIIVLHAANNELSINSDQNVTINADLQVQIKNNPAFFVANSFFNGMTEETNTLLFIATTEKANDLQKKNAGANKLSFLRRDESQYTLFFNLTYKNEKVMYKALVVQNFIKYAQIYVLIKNTDNIDLDFTNFF